MNIVISSGHGKYVRGAEGILDEVDEARRVVSEAVNYLLLGGVGAIEFHDDQSHNQSDNLDAIVAFHNSKKRDLDVSVHFNCYDGSAHGTEVLYVTQSALAQKVCDAICAAGGFTNRGAKKRTDLAFLNGTNKPAILIETCFVDSQADANLYDASFTDICVAIAQAISGLNLVGTDEPDPPVPPPPTTSSTPIITVTIDPPNSALVIVRHGSETSTL